MGDLASFTNPGQTYEGNRVHRTLPETCKVWGKITIKQNNKKICSKMITSIIRYHTAIHYIMSITHDRFRPYWVSSGGCKKHSIINMLKKQIFHWVQKKEKCNAKQYDTAIQGMLYKVLLYHIVLHCIFLFFAPNGKFVFFFFFFSIFIIECFLHPPDETQ